MKEMKEMKENEVQKFVYPDYFKLCPEWTSFFYNIEIEDLIEEIFNDLTYSSHFNIKNIYPSSSDIFNCFYHTHFSSIKVVFVNDKEPYYNGSATGRCFDVKSGYVFPPILQTIYTELEEEGYYPTKDGNLENWSKQGVLLLSTSLTSSKNKKGEEHKKLWLEFLKKVFEKLSERSYIVWVLMGDTHMYEKYIEHPLHPIIKTTMDNMKGSGLFKKINHFLIEHKMEMISW